MNKKLISIVLACTLVFAIAGCGKKDGEKAPTAAATNVAVSQAEVGDIESTVSYTGDVKSVTSASVVPKVAGSVKAVYVEIGDFVNAGTVLMTIDSSSYQLAYNQAEATYKSATAAHSSAVAAYNNVKDGSNAQGKVSLNQSVTAAQTNYDLALEDYNKKKVLYDAGAISKVAFDAAQTALDNAKLALDTANQSANLNTTVIAPQTEAGAKAGVEQAKAAMEQAKVAVELAADNLANCTVTAPISGYIASKNVIIGQTVSQAMESFAIKNSNALEVEINVTEAVIGAVNVGTKAKINVKSAGVSGAEGIVTVAGEAKNPATGMYTVKVAISDADEKIKDGMIADVVLTTGTVSDVLIVPQSSILTAGDETYVYVAEGNTAVKKVITTGLSNENVIEVTSGLNEGEQVITEGKEFLSDKNNAIKITSNE